MGLFGGDEDESETQEVDPPEADASHDDAEGTPSDEASPQASDQDSGDGQDGSGPASSESGLDVEEALKELSARMAVLSSNLEGVQESRGDLEDKLGTVEERMSRLGSLAEAVSSEYNPFISENAPDQPSWTPNMEESTDPGLDPDPSSSSLDEDTNDAQHPDPPGLDEPIPAAPDDEPSWNNGEDTDTDSLAEKLDEIATLPRTDPERLEQAPTEEIEDVEPQPYHDPFGGNRELEENLLLLEWVGMMLDRVGRAGLLDLLDYYRNLGWLDKETKDRATRVAVGVDAPDRVEQDHWRGDVDLHRQSLVAIQRLQGNEVPAARIDELQLDMQRLFEG